MGSGSWSGSIAEHRIRIQDSLEDTPSLKNYLPEVLPSSYKGAIQVASQKKQLNRDTFPEICEWDIQQVLDEDWFPD